MKAYEITVARVEYYSQKFKIEAENEDDAQDKAWDLMGKWRLVEAEEFVNDIKEIKNA